MLTPDELAAIRAHFTEYANEVGSDDALRLCDEIDRLRAELREAMKARIEIPAEYDQYPAAPGDDAYLVNKGE